MAWLLRSCLLVLVVLGLALAGPVQAGCAMPVAAPAPAAMADAPCAGMAMDEGGPGHPSPEAPRKACTILQCPATPPAVAETAAAIARPASHPVRHAALPSRVMTGADRAPEQRPPIS